jgi:hypothetical protein
LYETKNWWAMKNNKLPLLSVSIYFHAEEAAIRNLNAIPSPFLFSMLLYIGARMKLESEA